MIVKLLTILWVVGIGIGFSLLAGYQFTPGKQLSAPEEWITAAESRRPRLYVFLHPECPCSQATLSELERIQAVTLGRLDICVELVIPRSTTSYESAPVVIRAKSNRHWAVATDLAGVRAAPMGAATSGFVVLYDERGEKVFQGGITPSRGHEGDNAGVDSIAAYLQGHKVVVRKTPVYGCSLGLVRGAVR